MYPAHGPGSSCGKSIGSETQSTIGEQKKLNYALQAQTKEEFIKAVTEGLEAPPAYFPINAKINSQGYEHLDVILQQALQPLSVEAVASKLNDDVLLLDTRPATEFAKGFIPGSVSIGLEGRFAEWAGNLLPFNQEVIMVTEPGKEKESATRLARVGFDKMIGFVEGGFEAWEAAGEKVDMIVEIEADELAMDIPFDPRLVVLDVRRATEYADGHVDGAINIPLDDMNDPGSMANIKDDDNLYVHCAGGYRSIIACSLLKRQGIHNLRNVQGGLAEIKKQDKIKIVKEASVLN
jgi:hydroxyacylglutathione hydrolase